MVSVLCFYSVSYLKGKKKRKKTFLLSKCCLKVMIVNNVSYLLLKSKNVESIKDQTKTLGKSLLRNSGLFGYLIEDNAIIFNWSQVPIPL